MANRNSVFHRPVFWYRLLLAPAVVASFSCLAAGAGFAQSELNSVDGPGHRSRIRQNSGPAADARILANSATSTRDGARSAQNDGADRLHWAFQRLVRPNVPAVPDSAAASGRTSASGNVRAARVETPVDAFLWDRLADRGLTFSPEADRATLVRRVFFDLMGLPPPPEDVVAYESDVRPDAYQRLIDRLLESPHFGERWGRHWLDAAGYVDVLGSDNDASIIKPLPGKWQYRDYVIRSLNEDKPFHQFLVEQLAGDELVDWRGAATFTPEIKELLIATGFLLCAADDTDQHELNTPDIRHRVLQLTGEIVAGNLLAVTLSCAKCHDHKYEAILQEDYYRFLAVFSPAFNPDRWVVSNARGIPDISAAEKAVLDHHNGEIDKQVGAIKQRLADLRRPQLDAKPEEIASALAPEDRATIVELERQTAALEVARRTHGTIQTVYEREAPTATFLLQRGDILRPGPAVTPGLPRMLTSTPPLPPDQSTLNSQPSTLNSQPSSGRRLALARQLVNGESAVGGLVARVIVNRVWQTLFGSGIVATSDNFGVSGAQPTHPELLDWLACEFVRGGWRVKPLIRFLMLSSAYQQASTREEAKQDVRASESGRIGNPYYVALEEAEKIDPENQLLWRMAVRRLESEIVRDAVLAVSGMLDGTMGGESVLLDVQPDGKVISKADGRGGRRRSIYLLARRNYQLSLLNTFDQPLVATHCTRREPAASVAQSLTMLNDDFVLTHAAFFAQRVAADPVAATLDQRIGVAFQLALGRTPDEQETDWCKEFCQRHMDRYRQTGLSEGEAQQRALVHLCHMLLNTNEFLYVP